METAMVGSKAMGAPDLTECGPSKPGGIQRQRGSSSPTAFAYEIAGDKLKKVGRGLTWTPGLQDINERNLRTLGRLGKGIRAQTIAIRDAGSECNRGRGDVGPRALVPLTLSA